MLVAAPATALMADTVTQTRKPAKRKGKYLAGRRTRRHCGISLVRCRKENDQRMDVGISYSGFPAKRTTAKQLCEREFMESDLLLFSRSSVWPIDWLPPI